MIGSEATGGNDDRLERAEKSWQVNTKLNKWADEKFNLTERNIYMLWTIIVILVVLWLLGFIGHFGGALIHLLLVIAVIVLVIQLIQGSRRL
jgi:tryptophan-rich sensory protein